MNIDLYEEDDLHLNEGGVVGMLAADAVNWDEYYEGQVVEFSVMTPYLREFVDLAELLGWHTVQIRFQENTPALATSGNRRAALAIAPLVDPEILEDDEEAADAD